MNYSHAELLNIVTHWLQAWARHDLATVMELFADDATFENWNGAVLRGKTNIQRSWASWFRDHGNFKFSDEDIFADASQQKILYRWSLEWPSRLAEHLGQPEVRRGVDVLRFKDGKLVEKLSYSKTVVVIDSQRIPAGG